MKVKALVDCFVDNGFRKEGETFDCGNKFIPELMEPLEPVVHEEESTTEAPRLRRKARTSTDVSA